MSEDEVDQMVTIEVTEKKVTVRSKKKHEMVVEPFLKLIPSELRSLTGQSNTGWIEIQFVVSVSEGNQLIS